MDFYYKGKGNHMADWCDDTSVASIVNVFIKIFWDEIKLTLVGLYDDLSGAAETAIDFPNDAIIAHLNYTPLIYGGSNYLISTPQSHEFDMTVRAVSKRYGGK